MALPSLKRTTAFLAGVWGPQAPEKILFCNTAKLALSG